MAKEKIKLEQLQKLQKDADVGVSYEDLLKMVKINEQGIFSKIWKSKIKSDPDIRCLDSSKWDPLLVAQRGLDWWADFSHTMLIIDTECEKIL